MSMDIQKFLKRKGITASELARQLDLNPSSIIMWKSGKSVPKYEICLRLIELGIGIDELFNDSALEAFKKMYSQEIRGEVVLSPEECAQIVSRGLSLLRDDVKGIQVHK